MNEQTAQDRTAREGFAAAVQLKIRYSKHKKRFHEGSS